MDWDERFSKVINGIYNESDFSVLGKELFNLAEFYLQNDVSGFEEKYDRALEESPIMKANFEDIVTSPKSPAQIGSKLSFSQLYPIALPEIPTLNYKRTIVVCLRHFL